MEFVLAFSIDVVRDWVQESGYWGGVALVFGLLFACGLGFPLPEDVPLIVAGAFLVNEDDPLRTWLIAGAACWCGIIGGDIMLYTLGKKYGMNVTRLPFLGRHLTAERIEHVEKLFEKYGVLVVGVGRLFAGIRGAMVVTAGTIRFHFVKFLIADGIAALFSGGMFMLVGHWLGKTLNDEKIREFKHWFIGGAIVLAALVVAWVVWKRRTGGSLSAKLEAKLERKLEERLEQRTEAAAPEESPRP